MSGTSFQARMERLCREIEGAMGWFYKQIHWTQDPYTSDVRFIDPGSGFMFSVPYPVERDEVAKQLVLYKLTQRLIS